MKEIRVHTPFTLTTADGQLKKFDTGRHCVEDAVAAHWFVQAHAEQTDTALSEDDADMQALKAALLEKQERIDALTAQVEELESQLATLLSGGGEEAADAENQNLPDVNKFRTDFPLFSDDVRYPDAQVQFRLDLAGTMLNEKNTGKALFPYLVELFVAHYLVLYDQDRRAVAAGGSGGASTGAVSSKSVDKVSVSYDTSVTLNADAGFWNTTRYGAEFWQYLRLAGAGGRQL